MKKIIFSAIVCISIWNCTVNKKESTTEVYDLYVTSSDLPLYQTPYNDSVVYRLEKGDSLVVLKTKEYYHLAKITTRNGKELYGWTGIERLKYVSRSTRKAFGTPPTVSNNTANSSYRYSYPSGRDSTASRSSSGGGSVNVRGYYRKDGTYVRPYTRSAPRKH